MPKVWKKILRLEECETVNRQVRQFYMHKSESLSEEKIKNFLLWSKQLPDDIKTPEKG